MKTDILPKGYVRCSSIQDIYRLRPRKKKRTMDNMELDTGKEVFIYSHLAKGYRKYTIEKDDPWQQKVEQFINMGIVYHRP